MDFLKKAAKSFGEGVILSAGIVVIAMFATVGTKLGEKMGDVVVDKVFPEPIAENNEVIVVD